MRQRATSKHLPGVIGEQKMGVENLNLRIRRRMKKVNSRVAPPSEWRIFDFWKSYVTVREFYEAIKSIHVDQQQFASYPDAAGFLSSLKNWSCIS
jgi:hypothetical protein